MWWQVFRLATRHHCSFLNSLKFSPGWLIDLSEKQLKPTWASPLPLTPHQAQYCHPRRINGTANSNFATVSSQDITELSFNKLADETLENMLTALEDFLQDLDLDDADVDYGQGVLTLKLGDKGTFVLNKQTPNRQLWLSSPVSGPFRYDMSGGDWLYSHDGHKLQDKLVDELEILCGRRTSL